MKGKFGDMPLLARPGDLDLWHAAPKDPGCGPGPNVLVMAELIAGGLEGANQVGPFGVGVGVFFEVEPQAVAKGFVAEKVVKLL